MKVFVTGGTGVLGRVAVRARLDDGHQVTGLARGVDKARSREAGGASPMSVTRALEPAALGVFAEVAERSTVGFLPGFVVRIAGERLEPLTRSHRISSAKLHEMTGWKPAHPVFEPQWIRAHSPR